MPYRNFRTADSGLGNLFLLAVLITLGIIGLTRPSSNIAAIDRGATPATSRIDSATTSTAPVPPTIAPRSGDAAELSRETSRILEQRDETTAGRAVQDLHHDRDFKTPSTLSDPVPGDTTTPADTF